MDDSILTVDVEGKPADFADAFVIRVPYRIGAIALVAVLGIIWGLQYSTAKLISFERLGAMETLFIVHLALSVIFIAMLLRTGWRFWPNPEQAAFFGIISLFNNLVPLGVELFTTHHVSAGEWALIISLTPIAVLIFTLMLQSERLTERKTSGILIGCLAGGIILLLDALMGGDDGVLWRMVAFLGPVLGRLGNVIMAKH